MIHFLVPAAGAYTLDEYFSLESPEVVGRFRVIHYEDLPRHSRFDRGTYVFAGLDQLTPGMLQLVGILHQALSATDGIRILNDPGKWLGRFRLLSALHAAGRNDFRAFRVTDDLRNIRYPVFLRGERDHGGNFSPLLHSASELHEAIGRSVVREHPLEDLLAVEFNSTVDPDGLYRKYAAYRVGDRILGRSLFHSRHWMVKFSKSEYTRALVLEEQEYVRSNPHAGLLAPIFALAQIDYGQIDYSFKDGRIQTWEINVHPTIGRGSSASGGAGPPELRPIRSETRELFFDRFRQAWEAVDLETGGSSTVAVHFDREVLRAALPPKPRGNRFLELVRAIVRPIKPVIEPLTRRVLEAVGAVARRIRPR